jgi:hypothetical protein
MLPLQLVDIQLSNVHRFGCAAACMNLVKRSMSSSPAVQLDDMEVKLKAVTCIKRTLAGPRGAWCEDFVAESVVSEISEAGVPDSPEIAAQRFSELLYDNYEASSSQVTLCHLLSKRYSRLQIAT